MKVLTYTDKDSLTIGSLSPGDCFRFNDVARSSLVMLVTTKSEIISDRRYITCVSLMNGYISDYSADSPATRIVGTFVENFNSKLYNQEEDK